MNPTTLALAAICCCSCLLWSTVSGQEATTDASSRENVCISLECIQQATRMASWMDPRVNPCHDFYEYACGNFGREALLDARKAIPDAGFMNPFKYENVIEYTSTLVDNAMFSRLYEMLIRPSLVTHPDPPVNEIFTFAKDFFTTCSKLMFDQEASGGNDEAHAQLLSGLLVHMQDDLRSREIWTTEALFATILKTGAGGMLKASISRQLVKSLVINPGILSPVGNPTFLLEVSLSQVLGDQLNLQPLVEFVSRFADPLGFNFLGREAEFVEVFSSLEVALRNDSWISRCPIELEDGTQKYVNQSSPFIELKWLQRLSECASFGKTFSWIEWLDHVLGYSGSLDRNILIFNPVPVINLANFLKLHEPPTDGEFLASKHTVFLLLDWLLRFADFFPEKLRYKIGSQKTIDVEQPRDKDVVGRCMELTLQSLEPILARMYHTIHGGPDIAPAISELLYLALSAAKQTVDSHDWLSAQTKRAILDRLKNTTYSIGFNNRPVSWLKEFYGSMLGRMKRLLGANEVSASKKFGHMLATALRANWQDAFVALVSGQRNFSTFDADSTLSSNVHALCSDLSPEHVPFSAYIVISFGWLKPPFFHPSLPEYINLGGIGMALAHEVHHVLLCAFRSIEGSHVFQNETVCLRDQYQAILEESFGNQVRQQNFRKNLKMEPKFDEDLSDIFGVSVASDIAELFLGMRDRSMRNKFLPDVAGLGLTREMMFFVTAAQNWCTKSDTPWMHYLKWKHSEHSENRIRVIGEMMHSKKFSTVFNCRASDRMSPEENCTFWELP